MEFSSNNDVLMWSLEPILCRLNCFLSKWLSWVVWFCGESVKRIDLVKIDGITSELVKGASQKKSMRSGATWKPEQVTSGYQVLAEVLFSGSISAATGMQKKLQRVSSRMNGKKLLSIAVEEVGRERGG